MRKSLSAVLEDCWKSLPVEDVLISEIELEPETFQPRKGCSSRTRDYIQNRSARRQQKKRLIQHLKAGGETEDAIWCFKEIDGNGCAHIILNEGHQRYVCYQEAGRLTIPCRIYRGPDARKRAKVVAGFINNRGTRVPLLDEEAAEACWQFVSTLTEQGKHGLERSKWSTRTIAEAYGGSPSYGLVAKMVNKAKRIRLKIARSDPWPTWEEAKGIDRPGGDIEDKPREDFMDQLRLRFWSKLEKNTPKRNVDLFRDTLRDYLEYLEEVLQGADEHDREAYEARSPLPF